MTPQPGVSPELCRPLRRLCPACAGAGCGDCEHRGWLPPVDVAALCQATASAGPRGEDAVEERGPRIGGTGIVSNHTDTTGH